MTRAVLHRVTALLGLTCISGLLASTMPASAALAGTPASTPVVLALNCPSGWFCFYDETGFLGDRGKLSSCGWQNLRDFQWANRIEAAYYNLSSGSASFYESNGTYLFQVTAANRSLSDVGSKQNKADKVYRAC
jgi:hypothetical protein